MEDGKKERFSRYIISHLLGCGMRATQLLADYAVWQMTLFFSKNAIKQWASPKRKASS